MKRIFVSLFTALLLFFGAADGAWAQVSAQISGTVKDQSGAVLPGAEVRVTQTETGVTRDAVTNETGSYVLPNLPIGPYRLDASLPGFRTYAQTGIVLQVNSTPVINVVLEVGQVSEQVEVQANAALVETRSSGVGSVVENVRILELPLNGRSMMDLVQLSGAATPAPTLDGTGGRDPFSKGNLSVAGGMNAGLNYTLDGAYHNNPFDAGYLSMPFPDALQEFKVETGATSAEKGVKSSGSVSLVTKSGTNDLHGNLFEFVRNGKFNARNAFASSRDTIKRNQFGGTLGGAIAKNKLFFFSGYQGTTFRQDPKDQTSFVPTVAMLGGDFTAFASPACNAGRQITLRGPFVNNRVDPKLFSKPAVNLAAKLPVSTDPCGKVLYGIPNIQDDHMAVGRLDYQKSASHSIFGRYLMEWIRIPAPFDVTHSPLISGSAANGKHGLAQAFTIGDTYLIGGNVVNAFRLTANREAGGKFPPDFSKAGIGPTDIGVKAFAYLPHRPDYSVTGGFSSGYSGAGPANVAVFAANDDISIIHGNHQWAFGAQGTLWYVNSYADAYNTLNFMFNGQTTGLGMADFFMGNAAELDMGTNGNQNKKQTYIGLYATDTWKVSRRLTFNYGLRYEPYFPIANSDGSGSHFDHAAFSKGIKSSRFDNAPPGIFFQGDKGFPGAGGQNNNLKNFSPRLGFAWDASGDGRTSLRASVATFYDSAPARFLVGLSNAIPWTPRLAVFNVNFENPWAGYPGGDPFPIPNGNGVPKSIPWSLYPIAITMDYDSPNLHVDQWNLSLQRQIGTDWLVSANYIGNHTTHLYASQIINPAVFLGLGPCTINGVSYNPCSSTANTNQRRRLSLENPAAGQYYGALQRVDPGATASYNGMILSVQHQAGRGVTLNANYTWSHCITDPGGIQTGTLGTDSYTNPDNRHLDRGNCSEAGTDRRHLFNMSAVAQTPHFANRALSVAASNWSFSPIVRIMTGEPLTVTTNQDRALDALPTQRVNQVLGNPYGNKTVKNFLNPSAFALPALGTVGNLGRSNIPGPGYWQFDAAISRTFQLRETQKLEFRWETFNIPNAVRLDKPTTVLNSNNFGQITTAQDPRIMQFALKYVF